MAQTNNWIRVLNWFLQGNSMNWFKEMSHIYKLELYFYLKLFNIRNVYVLQCIHNQKNSKGM